MMSATLGTTAALSKVISLSKVSTLHKVFGWPMYRVTFTNQGKPVAVLSFAKTKSGWHAMPHADSLGAWFDKSVVENITLASQLINCLLTEGNLFEDTARVSIRSTMPLLSYRTEHKVISVISLEGGYDAVMSRLNANVRRKISKSARCGIVVLAGKAEHIDSAELMEGPDPMSGAELIGGPELIDDFYSVYRKTIHKHGSFGLPKGFFSNIPPEEGSLFVAFLNNKPIGSALLTRMMDTSENTAFATLPCYNKLYTSYALHHAMIQHAINTGCSIYSFGRSTPASSVHRFKQQWGAVDNVLYYNSTHPVKVPGNYELTRKVIRHLPMGMSAAFDRFVAKRIF